MFDPELMGVLGSAFVLGLLGGAHCIGMCGGLMAAMSFSLSESSLLRRLTLMLSYNLGRIGSYALLGALAGWLGLQLSSAGGLGFLRILAGGLLIAMGLYIADWWRGLTYLEKAGVKVWQPLQKMTRGLLPVRNPATALILGSVWGWLPCGLVYSMLAYALSQAQPGYAALVMVAFGLGTLPTLMVAGVFAERLRYVLHRRSVKWLMGLCIIGFGIWTMMYGFGHGKHGDHNHGDASMEPAVIQQAPMHDHSQMHH